jgi:alkylation response protein AidB-like acyl-CoA dehydrogenase
VSLDVSENNHPARLAVQKFLAEHPNPTGRDLAEAGYVVPHWPAPYGLDADPRAQLIIDEELRAAGVRRPVNPIGIGWAGPTLLAGGSSEQQERYLPKLLSGEDFWCQLFSEPDAGSDLSALRTTAVKDGEEFIVNGSKIWTSYGHIARYGILLARTDPEAEQHQGISYFVCPMDLPGITIRPLVDMTGDHAFNEVFFDDVRISAECLVGELHRGWSLAKVTLMNERVSLSGEGALWGRGPTVNDLLDLVHSDPRPLSPALRRRLVDVVIEARVLAMLRERLVGTVLAGRKVGPEASIRKALADEHGQHVMELAVDFGGLAGQLRGFGPHGTEASDALGWSHGFLYSQALTIGGGTKAVQRNIIAERILGLPRDL